ncbi:unnamed protein product, partial [Gulo gulo]
VKVRLGLASSLLHSSGKARLPYFLLGPSHLAHSPCIVFLDWEIRATTILPEGKQCLWLESGTHLWELRIPRHQHILNGWLPSHRTVFLP